MNNVVKTIAALAAFTLLGGSVLAQTPPPAPAHHGIFSKLFHPKPKPGTVTPMHPGMMPNHSMLGGHSMMPGHSMMQGGTSALSGQFIGNKNSHVYHMPGDRGAMPAPQNRVYFASAAAAEAAGYHAAGNSHSTKSNRTVRH